MSTPEHVDLEDDDDDYDSSECCNCDDCQAFRVGLAETDEDEDEERPRPLYKGQPDRSRKVLFLQIDPGYEALDEIQEYFDSIQAHGCFNLSPLENESFVKAWVTQTIFREVLHQMDLPEGEYDPAWPPCLKRAQPDRRLYLPREDQVDYVIACTWDKDYPFGRLFDRVEDKVDMLLSQTLCCLSLDKEDVTPPNSNSFIVSRMKGDKEIVFINLNYNRHRCTRDQRIAIFNLMKIFNDEDERPLHMAFGFAR